MDLPSDDEDSDYSMSEESSEDEREVKKTKRQLKREEELEKERLKMKEKIDSLFDDMLKESDLINSHKQSVNKSDFMLQFHKKDGLPRGRKNSSLGELQHFTSVSSSSILSDAPTFDIRDFKEKCRNIPDTDKLDIIKKAGSSADAVKPAVSVRTYTFAGKTYTITEEIDKSSRKYKQYLKKQQNKLGGGFAFIDDMASQLESVPKISAIKKSEADWNQYKDDKKIDTLKSEHKFLKEQDFLYRTSWKEHDKYISGKNK